MREATIFSQWMSQDEDTTLNQNDIDCLSAVDITSKLSAPDLVAVLYHGKGDVPMLALSALKEKFEWEMHRLEELNHPQGAEA